MQSLSAKLITEDFFALKSMNGPSYILCRGHTCNKLQCINCTTYSLDKLCECSQSYVRPTMNHEQCAQLYGELCDQVHHHVFIGVQYHGHQHGREGGPVMAVHSFVE